MMAYTDTEPPYYLLLISHFLEKINDFFKFTQDF